MSIPDHFMSGISNTIDQFLFVYGLSDSSEDGGRAPATGCFTPMVLIGGFLFVAFLIYSLTMFTRTELVKYYFLFIPALIILTIGIPRLKARKAMMNTKLYSVLMLLVIVTNIFVGFVCVWTFNELVIDPIGQLEEITNSFDKIRIDNFIARFFLGIILFLVIPPVLGLLHYVVVPMLLIPLLQRLIWKLVYPVTRKL